MVGYQDLQKTPISHQERQTQVRRRAQIIKEINVQSAKVSMVGVNNLQTRAVLVKSRVPRGNTAQTAVTTIVKETRRIGAVLDPKKDATVSPVARKGKTQ